LAKIFNYFLKEFLQQPMMTPLILDGTLISGPSSPYIMEGVTPINYCLDAVNTLETENPPQTYILNNNVCKKITSAELI